jgi:hypothetical protein
MYVPRNWEFGSALSKLRNFGGVNAPTPLGTPLHLSERMFWGVAYSTAGWERGAGGVPCDHGNELPGSIKCWGLLD